MYVLTSVLVMFVNAMLSKHWCLHLQRLQMISNSIIVDF